MWTWQGHKESNNQTSTVRIDFRLGIIEFDGKHGKQ